MLSGPIRSKSDHKTIDRSQEEIALWERGENIPLELPWPQVKDIGVNELKKFIAHAQYITLTLGAGDRSRELLEHVLSNLPSTTKLYIYADAHLETHTALIDTISKKTAQVLLRLGHRPPADWLTIDGGASAFLEVGAHSEERRWHIKDDRLVARSLFEAFRVLFWFHATREGLPDQHGKFELRTPLKAPFTSPGDNIPLPAGRLSLNQTISDVIADAVLRITPEHLNPGFAKTSIIPLGQRSDQGRAKHPISLSLPADLARQGSEVVYINTGLPKLTITKQRMVMLLEETPISLQLEWPQEEALALFYPLKRAAAKPAWRFCPNKMLREITAEVFIEGSTAAQPVITSHSIDLGELEAQLLSFEATTPTSFPKPPPLACSVHYKWEISPALLPKGAAEAQIVKQWRAVDDWFMPKIERVRDDIKQGKARAKSIGEEHHSQLRFNRIEDQLNQHAEINPSANHYGANEQIEQLRRTIDQLNQSVLLLHHMEQSAIVEKAHEAAKQKHEERLADAQAQLQQLQQQLEADEEALGLAQEAQQAAQEKLQQAIDKARTARRDKLIKERQNLEQSSPQNASTTKPGNKSKRAAKPQTSVDTNKKIKELDEAINNWERWAPPERELGETPAHLKSKTQEVERLKAGMKLHSKERDSLTSRTQETLTWSPPKHAPAPPSIELGAPPPLPVEGLPERGVLYEHQRERYLVIKTWEELKPAASVADRLRAKLVVAHKT